MIWFRKKEEKTESNPPPSEFLKHVEGFLEKYDRLTAEKSNYAMTLWGINEAFNKVFGSLEAYHSADPSKRKRYIALIVNNAINDFKAGNMVSADCNRAFINYVSATNGISRSSLRGAIEHFADRIDDIITFGKNEIERIGEIETRAKSFIASDATFSVGTGTVQGAVTERTVVAASQIIINVTLPPICPRS